MSFDFTPEGYTSNERFLANNDYLFFDGLTEAMDLNNLAIKKVKLHCRNEAISCRIIYEAGTSYLVNGTERTRLCDDDLCYTGLIIPSSVLIGISTTMLRIWQLESRRNKLLASVPVTGEDYVSTGDFTFYRTDLGWSVDKPILTKSRTTDGYQICKDGWTRNEPIADGEELYIHKKWIIKRTKTMVRIWVA